MERDKGTLSRSIRLIQEAKGESGIAKATSKEEYERIIEITWAGLIIQRVNFGDEIS